MESHGIWTNGVDFPHVSNPNETPVRKVPATFQCTLCPKKFARAYNLRYHFRKHTHERPFACAVCGQAFTEKYGHTIHMRLHSGEKNLYAREISREVEGGDADAPLL